MELANPSKLFATGFVKRGLIHISNFSTLRMCNSACIGPTVLKFDGRTFLSFELLDRKILA